MVDPREQMDILDTLQYKTDHHLENKVVLRQVINHLDFLQHKAGLHMVDLRQQMDTPQYKTDHHLGNKVVLRQVINHLDFLQHKAGLHMVDRHQQMDTLQYKTDYHLNTLHHQVCQYLHEQLNR